MKFIWVAVILGGAISFGWLIYFVFYQKPVLNSHQIPLANPLITLVVTQPNSFQKQNLQLAVTLLPTILVKKSDLKPETKILTQTIMLQSTQSTSSASLSLNLATLTPTPVPTMISENTLNKITNGDFAAELAGWEVLGNIEILVDKFSCDNQIDIPEPIFEKYARLGSEKLSAEIGKIKLQQELQLDEKTFGLEFWYRVWTTETALGFDDPVLMVTLDNQLLWRVGSEVAFNPEKLNFEKPITNCSGWRRAVVPFPKNDFKSNYKILNFLAGQVGDTLNPSWVEIAHLKLLSEVVELPNLNLWPESIQISPLFDKIDQLSLIEVDKMKLDLFNTLVNLSAPILAENYQLVQPLLWPYELNYQASLLGSSTSIILSDDFPFSLDHEGFTGNLLLTDQVSLIDSSKFRPSWLKLENLWQQPLMVLPITSRENQLL